MEVYPSLAEGIGLENRQAGNTARGSNPLPPPVLNSDYECSRFCPNCMYYLLDTTSASVVVFLLYQ